MLMPSMLGRALAAVPMGLACFLILVYLLASGALSDEANSKRCVRTNKVVRVEFDSSKYPNVKKHYEDAISGRGSSHLVWPRILILDRDGDDDSKRRDKLMRMNKGRFPSRGGEDRDEYPPASGRGRGGPPLTRGWLPRGWKADLAYVPDGENQAHGASLGWQLMRYCDGTYFKYVWTHR